MFILQINMHVGGDNSSMIIHVADGGGYWWHEHSGIVHIHAISAILIVVVMNPPLPCSPGWWWRQNLPS
jgi:hypothetical protein